EGRRGRFLGLDGDRRRPFGWYCPLPIACGAEHQMAGILRAGFQLLAAFTDEANHGGPPGRVCETLPKSGTSVTRSFPDGSIPGAARTPTAKAIPPKVQLQR